MSNSFKVSLLWLFGGTIAVLFSLNFLTGSPGGTTYIPFGYDTFYHAQRIIPTIKDSSAFYEYDYQSYVPEGAWVSWPWAYDYMLAISTRIISKLLDIKEPLAVLTYIPVIWLYVNSALLLGIGVALRLKHLHLLLLMLCFSFSPLTQFIHAAGRFDHHFMEYTAVLATILSTLLWLKQPESRYRAIFLGIVLGLSPGIQNGLFILQLPVIITFFTLWLIEKFPKTNNVYTVAVAFLFSTILLLIPSEPFRNLLFSYYLLSWFHLLVAISSIFTILYFRLVSFSPKNLIIFLVLSLIITLPLTTNIINGVIFVGGKMEGLQDIFETRSPFGLSSGEGFDFDFNWEQYSLLIYLAPLSITYAIYQIYKKENVIDIAFGVFTIFGLLMLSMQFRFNYYGTFALYLPVLILLSRLKISSAKKYILANAAVILLLIIAYYPGYKNLLSEDRSSYWFASYSYREAAYIKLGQQCKEDPGVVLVPLAEAHIVTYLTSCKVLANNMFINSEQAQARMRVMSYYNNTADNFYKSAPNVKYVVAFSPGTGNSTIEEDKEKSIQSKTSLNIDLMGQLKSLPNGYELIDETILTFSKSGRKHTFMRLFKINRNNNE